MRILKYTKGKTSRHTRHVPRFIWFWLLVVELWMNEVLQVAKMVLSLGQRTFIVKGYYETHSLKMVLIILHSIFKIWTSVWYSKTNTRSVINWLGKTTHGDLREEGGTCNECHGAPIRITTTTDAAGRAFTHADIPYTLFHSLPIKILIQHKLKPADSPKRAEFCWWLCHYVHTNVSVFDIFFFSHKAIPFRWLHT